MSDDPGPLGRLLAAGEQRRGLVGWVLFALLVLPLAVALAAMHQPRWYPIADLAQTELRVRDVGGRNTPLMGLAGRIGPLDDAGSHPGPLSFWVLAPVYRVLGSSSWAFVASSLAVQAGAVATALVLARRRGGLVLTAAVAGALAVLMAGYGTEVFIEPWNPHLPVMWWVVFLLALWSVLDGDAPVLVVAVAAGSLCAQTHLPYLGLFAGMAAFLAVPLALALVPRWRAWRAARSPGGLVEVDRGRLARWTAVAAAVGVALWIPTLLDELFGTGNVTKIRESLGDPAEPIAGVGTGFRMLLFQLDPAHLLEGNPRIVPADPTEWNRAGLALLVAWALAAVGAWRLGHRSLTRLHAVLAAGLLLGWASISRVYGVLWYYLFLWAWGLMVLMALAIAATSAVALARRVGPARAPALRAGAVGVALVVAAVATGSSTIANADAQPSRPDLSASLGDVAGQTIDVLDRGDAVGGGREGRYLVRWLDRLTIGSQGIGLVNELERAGFTAGVDQPFGSGAVRHRILPEAEATAVLILAVGPDIRELRSRPGVEQVAYTDDRTEAEVAEADALQVEIDAELRADGLDAIAEEWKVNLFTATLAPGLPRAVLDKMVRVLDIGAPVAVFASPPAP